MALLGPRQAGKSTLAKKVQQELGNTIYLDLELPSDLQKLDEPEIFFQPHEDKLICLDEIQRKPEIFSVLRSVIDQRNRNGQFLILGSASRDLIKQSSETLAGRIVYLELTPFLHSEILKTWQIEKNPLNRLWLRGGFPRSYLSENDELSYVWRQNFIRTFLERDIPQLGFQIPADTLRRLWQMCAHLHGGLLNLSSLSESIGVTHPTIRSHLDILSRTFTIRLLKPFQKNVGKRLVKTPKLYIRDSGILHALLNISTFDELMGHPSFGASWEGLASENIITWMQNFEPFFYRTSAGAELDLLLIKGQRKVGVEFKASMAPKPLKGFWHAIEDLNLTDVYIVAPVEDTYQIRKNVTVTNLRNFYTKYG
ncbi:MAG: ATP-binding protein [bacterium]